MGKPVQLVRAFIGGSNYRRYTARITDVTPLELPAPGRGSGQEVDIVIERDDGHVVGIEVKAGSRVSGDDLSGLRILRSKLGDAFTAGAVLYTGQRSYTVEDRLHVMPVERLWTTSK